MRLTLLATLALLALLWLPLHAETAPLTLTATADKDVLLARPLPVILGQSLKNQPRYDIETAQVTLTFTNTGDVPVKLNTYALIYDHLQLAISGQDAQSIASEPLAGDFWLAKPSAKDFPILQPGKSWTCVQQLALSDEKLGLSRYSLSHPGAYGLHFLYTAVQAEGPNTGKFADGSFLGAVASNTLTFTLVEASEPVQGLQIALAAQPAADALSDDVTLTGYLRNVSEKPIVVNAWDLFHDGLQFTGDDGEVIPFSGGANRSREATPGERYTTIPPGEKHAFPLRGGYHAALDKLTRQTGDIGVEDKTGFYRDWPVAGSAVYAVALLDTADTALQAKDAPGALWSGKVTSTYIVIPLNPTEYRQARLKQDVSQFDLAVNYTGMKPKYYSLHLHVPPLEENGTLAYNVPLQITEPAAATLIDYLAKSGALRDAEPFDLRPTAIPTGALGLAPDGYSMVITGHVIPGQQEAPCWTLDMGWNMATYQRLQMLRARLPKEGQTAMETLLKSLADPHDTWDAEAALRLRVTLDTSAGTLSEAAHAIHAALNYPELKLTIAPTSGALPVPALHLCNVTGREALQCLAEAANIPNTMVPPENPSVF